LLPEDQHQQINDQRNPELGFDGIGGGAVELLDVEMLLDLFEE